MHNDKESRWKKKKDEFYGNIEVELRKVFTYSSCIKLNDLHIYLIFFL